MRALLFAFVVSQAAALSALAEPPAATEDVRARAKLLSDRGRRFHDLGEYDRAIAAYREAYLLLPSPGVLFNLGQAYRLKGDCVQAASSYRSFLQSDQVDPSTRQVARTQLAVVDRCVREQPPAPPRRGRWLRGGGLVTAVTGGLVLGAGMYFVVDSHRASGEVERHYQEGGKWDDIADVDARGRRSANLALALSVSGGAAVATGAVLYVIGVRRGGSEPRVMVAPSATATATQVSVSWAF